MSRSATDEILVISGAERWRRELEETYRINTPYRPYTGKSTPGAHS
ncbi:MAG: hypothetical protein AAGD11_04200 [Planctomycetota bacterium]